MFHPNDIREDIEVLRDTMSCTVSHDENKSIGREYIPVYRARNKRVVLLSKERALRLNMNIIIDQVLVNDNKGELEEIKNCGLSNAATPEDNYYEFGYVEDSDVSGKLLIRLF